MAIDHRQLRYFIEVATVGSINKAAERLHIAQPALSRRMHLLGHELGAPLLERGSGGVSLTPVGRRLLGRAAAIVDELERLRTYIGEPPEAELEQVQIGMVPGPSLFLLTRVLAAFHRERPEVLLQVVDGSTPELCEMVLNRTIDLAIVTEKEPDPNLAIEAMWYEAIFLFGPPGYQDRLDELLELPFAMPTSYSPISRTIEAAVRRFGVSFRADLIVAATATVKQLVAEGGAFTVLPFSTIAEGGDWEVFSVFQVPDIRVRRDLVRRADATWTDATETLARILHSTARSVIRSYPDGRLIATGAEAEPPSR